MDKEGVRYIYIYIYGILLSHKKETMLFAATWIDLEFIILSEVSQKEKYKYYMISLACGIKNIIQKNLFTTQKLAHRHRKQMYDHQS